MIRGIIFDMDGVITDNNQYHEQAWTEFCSNYGISLTEEEIHQYIFGRVARDTLEYIFKRELSPDELSTYLDQKERIYRKLYEPHIKPVKGLMGLMASLKRQEYKLALATSAPPGNVDFMFHHIAIQQFFDIVLDGDSIKKGKPDPEIYLKAVDWLGLTPTECIIFEDSMPGIKAAIAAGATVIGLATTHQAALLKGVDMVIKDFTEFNAERIADIGRI